MLFDVAHHQSASIRNRTTSLSNEVGFFLERKASEREQVPERVALVRAHVHGYRMLEDDGVMDALFAELETRLPAMCDEGVRTVQVAAALKVSETTARKLLRQLNAEGWIELVRIQVEALNEKRMTVAAYRIKVDAASHAEE